MTDINPIPQNTVNNANTQRVQQSTTQQGSSTATSATGNAGKTDSVELTEQARLLRTAQQALSQLPEVDSAKVDALRERIASGEYTVDADLLAERLLEFETALQGDEQ